MTASLVTIQDLLDWDCCYTRNELEYAFDERSFLSAREIVVEKDTTLEDKIWVLSRMLWRADRWEFLRLLIEAEFLQAKERGRDELVKIFSIAKNQILTHYLNVLHNSCSGYSNYRVVRFNMLLYSVARDQNLKVPGFWVFPCGPEFLDNLLAALEDK